MRLLGFAASAFGIAAYGVGFAAGGTCVRMEVRSKGVVVIELEEEMPITTQNFLDYVDAGYYDGLIFHRVISGFMVQGGGFSPNMVCTKTVEGSFFFTLPVLKRFNPLLSRVTHSQTDT